MEASVEAILLTEAYTAESDNAPSSEMPTPDLVERPKTPRKGEVMFKLWSRFSASGLFRRRKRDKKSNSRENRMARNSVTYFAEALTASSFAARFVPFGQDRSEYLVAVVTGAAKEVHVVMFDAPICVPVGAVVFEAFEVFVHEAFARGDFWSESEKSGRVFWLVGHKVRML